MRIPDPPKQTLDEYKATTCRCSTLNLDEIGQVVDVGPNAKQSRKKKFLSTRPSTKNLRQWSNRD